MTVAEIQTLIFEQTGFKTSVKRLTGSMKKHTRFSVMFQDGNYQKFSFDWRRNFTTQFATTPGNGNYSNEYTIDIENVNITDFTPIKYKTERKPKPIELQSVKSWGSKNSQLRLDKATTRNAKKMQKGNCARYY